MRAILLAAATLALAQGAWAQPLAPEQISYSPEFQTALDEELGAREGEILRRAVADAINDDLGPGTARVEDPGSVVLTPADSAEGPAVRLALTSIPT